jgi:hypothetical protein
MTHGRISISQPVTYPGVSRLLRRLTLVWTADESGNADGEFTPGQYGELVRVLSVPGKGASRTRNEYTVALIDGRGIDVLEGRGRDQPGDRLVDFGAAGFIQDSLELRVSGAAPGASGRVVLYVRSKEESLC